MKLYEKIKRYFPEGLEKLTEEEIKYLEDEPFMTESCGDCSHFRWGSWTEPFYGALIEDTEYGDVPCCSDGEEMWEMSEAPDACPLTPEDALEWYFSKNPRPGYSICERYDGPIRYTKKEIEDWIRKRDRVIKKITGLNNLAEFEEYFKELERVGK